jgi:tocopherol O-methyltransferase
MTQALYGKIQTFYDEASGLWEQIWGEHMHHGYYGADGRQRKNRRQAQIDLIDECLAWAGITEAETILDCGCGIGGSSLVLAERYQARVVGITLSPVQVQRATVRAEAAGLGGETGPGARFEVADALHMPFADQSFDLVWSMESGEHMPDKVAFLQECYRVLKPEGKLLMATWCHRPTDSLGGALTWLEQQQLNWIYQVYGLPYVVSLPDYEAIARTCGFRGLTSADWSLAVAPFWDQVIASALTPEALAGLVKAGLGTFQGALALGPMRQGLQSGLIRYGLLCAER